MWTMLIRNFTQWEQLCQTKIKLNQQSGINPKLSTFDAKFQSTRFNKMFYKEKFSFKKRSALPYYAIQFLFGLHQDESGYVYQGLTIFR